MPTKGGRWVMLLKIGTKIKPPTPRKNTVLRCDSVRASPSHLHSQSPWQTSSPLSMRESRKAGTTIEMIDGTMISLITPAAVIRPLFQSIMVVTSPMGEKAPPELAAMITSEA